MRSIELVDEHITRYGDTAVTVVWPDGLETDLVFSFFQDGNRITADGQEAVLGSAPRHASTVDRDT